ncbi:MAG TPA: glycosyltransferase family 4 protein, partial [Candidatus Bathyarchaeia archaeon]
MGKTRLAVLNTQPPHLYFGGVERRILETAKRLTKELDMTVYSGTKAGFKKPTKVNGLNVVPCFSTDLLFPLDNWSYSHTLADSKNSIKADVYEAHNASGHAFVKSLKKKTPNTPFIQTVHGLLADEYFRTLESGSLSLRDRLANLLTWQLSKLEAESARAADFVAAVSKYSAKRATQLYNVDETKIRVAPNGVDPDRFKPAQNEEALRERFGLEQNKVVLFVGRLIPRKGLHFLVNTASQIVKELENVKFVLVGDGPLRAHLESSLAALGLSKHFLFLGDVEEGI